MVFAVLRGFDGRGTLFPWFYRVLRMEEQECSSSVLRLVESLIFLSVV